MAIPLSTVEGLPYLGGNAPGFVSVDSSGLQRLKKSKLDAVADPTTLDDSGAGYAVGSRWVNTASGKVWECVDSSPLAAVWKDLTAVSPPAGSGTELQYRNGSDFGAVSGSSVSGSDVTIAGLQIGASAGSGRGIGLGTAPPGSGGYNIIKSAGGIFLQPAAADSVFVRGSAVGSSRPLAWCDVGNNALVSLTPGSGALALSGTLLVPDGSAASPSVAFSSQTNSGLYWSGAAQVHVAVQGNAKMTYETAGVRSWTPLLLQNGGFLRFIPDSGATANAAMYAPSSGLVEINNGTAGTLRDLTCRNIYNNASQLRLQNQWTYHLGEGGFNGHTTKNGLVLHGNYGMYNAAPGNNLGGGVVLGFQASSSTAYEINNGTAGQYRDLRARGLHLSAAEFTHIRADYDASNWMYLQCEWGAGAWGFGNNAAAIKVDASNVAGETRILLHDVDSGQLQRVLVGANGSGPGGVGRALYLAAA